jgi:hypothetical protein
LIGLYEFFEFTIEGARTALFLGAVKEEEDQGGNKEGF